jgi:hypothetical protein
LDGRPFIRVGEKLTRSHGDLATEPKYRAEFLDRKPE